MRVGPHVHTSISVFVGQGIKEETLNLCSFNVGPTSQTVAQQPNNTGWHFLLTTAHSGLHDMDLKEGPYAA